MYFPEIPMNRMNLFRAGLLLLLFAFSYQTSYAQFILWNESINGDLSNNQAAPNQFTLNLGVNSIIANVNNTGGVDPRDFATVTVPAGLRLSALVLASYSSPDAQGFTGVQTGTSFVGSILNPASYLGYAHFGTGAVNGNLPPTNLVGVDILPIMGDTNLAAGSQGFTPPLQANPYTFLFQQTGASSTDYQFDFIVTAVPEPDALALLTLITTGAAGYCCRQHWQTRKAQSKLHAERAYQTYLVYSSRQIRDE